MSRLCKCSQVDYRTPQDLVHWRMSRQQKMYKNCIGINVCGSFEASTLNPGDLRQHQRWVKSDDTCDGAREPSHEGRYPGSSLWARMG